MSFARYSAYVFVAGGCVLLCVGSARAFSDPANFALSPGAAGGGGRFFTGSPADGYTCKVCHDGGAQPKVSVLGLPLAGYKPSESYEVTIKWPKQFEKIALAVELTNDRGEAAGQLHLPEPPEIKAAELCEPASDQVLAAQLTERKDGRKIINVPDCGAQQLRFLWTAPAKDVGQVWFAGSMVSSDGESDPLHDGVTDFGRVLGTSAVASETTVQCAVSTKQLARSRSALHEGWLLALASMVLSVRMRRRAKSAKLRNSGVEQPAHELGREHRQRAPNH